ncbi:unnamed protein product [Rhodiola kirilowii]
MQWNKVDDKRDSPSDEEPNNDGDLLGIGILRKGQWTPEEDAILIDYVTKHGEGNWNAVQKFSGLSRCGKSCRLRWANHLRPNLKKGAFTPEEERTIIQLHANLGNKWARMAAELPGRTDNEIKNFWNTRIKRHKRAQLPIYPDDILCLKKSSEMEQSEASGTFSNERSSGHSFMGAGNFDFPEFQIEDPFNLDLNFYQSKFLGIPTSHTPPQGLVSSYGFHYPAPTMHTQKGLRESDASHGLSDTATSSFFSQRNSYALGKHQQANVLPPFPESYCTDDPSLRVLPGSHALINGNTSTSQPNFGPVKLELPSLQSSETGLHFTDAFLPPVPSLNCTDNTLVQAPPAGPDQLQYTSDTDGLLQSLICPPNKENISKFEREADPKEKTTGDFDDLSLDLTDSIWEEVGDLISPMEPASASIFNDFTPLYGYSTDEPQPTDTMIGLQVKTSDTEPKQHPAGLTSSKQYLTIDSYQFDPSRPDTWLNANLLNPNSEQGREYLILQEAMSALEDDKNYFYNYGQG